MVLVLYKLSRRSLHISSSWRSFLPYFPDLYGFRFPDVLVLSAVHRHTSHCVSLLSTKRFGYSYLLPEQRRCLWKLEADLVWPLVLKETNFMHPPGLAHTLATVVCQILVDRVRDAAKARSVRIEERMNLCMQASGKKIAGYRKQS
jgi:hypothetical protein